MIFNLNFDPKVFHRIATALESLASNYATVHASELEAARTRDTIPKDAGRTFYQSDREVYLEEQRKRTEPAMEL